MNSLGAFASFRRSWRQEFFSQFATILMLISSYLVLTLALLAEQNLNMYLVKWGNEVKVNVYLKDNIEPQDKTKIQNFLTDAREFSEVKYLTKTEAAEAFKNRLGKHLPALLLDTSFENPLPASFEMQVQSGLKTNAQFNSLVHIAEQIKAMAGVDEVSYGQGWVENYASLLKIFSTVSAVFLAVLLLGGVFIVGHSVQNSISRRRDEIEILELFGATRRAIVWPFLFEGVVMGFIATVTALALSYIIYTYQASLISSSMTFWSSKIQIDFLSPERIVFAMLAGTFLGGFSAYLWSRKIATGWAAAEATRA